MKSSCTVWLFLFTMSTAISRNRDSPLKNAGSPPCLSPPDLPPFLLHETPPWNPPPRSLSPGGDWSPAPATSCCSGHVWEGASPTLAGLPLVSAPRLASLLGLPLVVSLCSSQTGSRACFAAMLLGPWRGCPLNQCHPGSSIQCSWCLIKHHFPGPLCTGACGRAAEWAFFLARRPPSLWGAAVPIAVVESEPFTTSC